jgi:hypothetical protein
MPPNLTPSEQRIEAEVRRLMKDMKRDMGQNARMMTKFTDLVGGVSNLLKDISEVPDQFSKSLKQNYGPLINNYEKIREVYGDISKMQGDRVTAAGAAFRRMDKLTHAMYMKQVEVDGVMMSTEQLFEKRLGSHSNFLYKNFEMKEVLEIVEAAQGDLNAQYARQINEMDDLTTLKIPAYTKGMGLSGREIGEIMRISILRTGKASTEMLDEVAAYSQAISRKTGIPMKFLNRSISDIITNVKLYGDVQVDEAARIAANVTQLGLKYEDLAKTQERFGKFSSAADNIGKISQITGVQLDAQRISFLSATGKMDEALIYMKDQFKKQGFKKEDFQNMTLPLRNAMSDAMVGGQEGVMNLLNMSKPFENIAEITAKTDTTKGFKAVTDNLDQTAKYAETSEKALEKMRFRALVPFGKQAHAAAVDLGKLKTEISELSFTTMEKQGMAAQDHFFSMLRTGTGGLNKVVGETVKSQADNYAKDMGTAYGLYTKEMAKKFKSTAFQDMAKDLYNVDTRSYEITIPESQLQSQGMYITNQINDANRPIHRDVVDLVTLGNASAVTQAQKDQAYKDAIAEHTVLLKEGHKLELKLQIVDQDGRVLSEEEQSFIKDAMRRYKGDRSLSQEVVSTSQNITLNSN